MKSRHLLTAAAVTLLLIASTAQRGLSQETAPNSSAAKDESADSTISLNEFVVTGVFAKIAKQDATVAVTTLDTQKMQLILPVSGADLLKNVPGVFVNSSLGEIRNMVYSRGVSANTADGATGYYYVSLQEDGLPVSNVSYSNFGPDYFHRPDATLDQVQAVRGGSASITAANAPGGVFNYISRKGSAQQMGEVRARFGLEGNGDFPFYRGDLDLGGPIGAGWLYNIGGFYRTSTGARDPGYKMNRGGQLKATVSKDWDRGSLKFHVKFLDDHNGWFEFLPAKNFNDPKVAPGVDEYGSNLLRPAKFNYVSGGINQTRNYDTESLVHSSQKALSAEWHQEFPGDWTIQANAKASDSRAFWNTSAGVALRSLGSAATFANVFITNSAGQVPAGTYVFKSRTDGQVLARVLSDGTAVSGNNTGLTVLQSSLPRQDLLDTGVWANTGRVADNVAKEGMGQMSVTKQISSMTFTVGGFYAYADVHAYVTRAGLTVSPIVNNPTPMDVTLITPTTGPYGGATLQLTDAQGFLNEGSAATANREIQKQGAVFFGHTWKINNRFDLDSGLRSEKLTIRGTNNLGALNPQGNYDATFGGADGNPLTIYDNRFYVRNATDWKYARDVKTFSWSSGVNIKIDRTNSVYLRYSRGEKAPDLAFFRSLTSALALATFQSSPQRVEQWEIGYKANFGKLHAVLTPFHSNLTNVLTNYSFTNPDRSAYSPLPLSNAVQTNGVELEGDYAFDEHFSLRVATTWQKATAKTWKIWLQNNPGPADDQILDLSGNKADNNPDLMATITPAYRSGKFVGQFTWKYMGDRPGNVADVITLPAFSQFDLALSYAFTKHLTVNANISNIFNGTGVMSWAGYGDNPLDRQSFFKIADPNTTFLIVPIQPRAYFVSATYTF